MATRNQIVQLRIQAAVEGLREISQLTRQLGDLGSEGNEAALELDALTRELKEIAGQQKLVDQFRKQKQATTELATAYAQARQASTQLGAALAQTEAPTRKQTAEFNKARQETVKLQNAYGTAQVKLQGLRKTLSTAGVDTKRLADAQQKLAQRSREATTQVTALESKVRQLATARPIPDVTRNIRTGAAQTSAVLTRIPQLLAAIGITAGLAQVVQAFTQAAKSGEAFERALNQITSSTDEAAVAQERLLAFSEKFGVSVEGLEKSYINFSAAVAGTNFEGERGQKIFESFAGAMGLLGKSSADIEGALNAVNQIISKNTVSSEELRQQLAERLPGAFRLSAEALGLTTAQLSKQLELGNITADQLLPRLATRLREAYGLDTVNRIEGIAAAQGRLSSATTEFFRALGRTGAANAFSSAIEGAASLLRGFTALIKPTTDDVDQFGRSSIETAADLDKLSGSAQSTAAAVQELNTALREQMAGDLSQQQADAAEQIDKFALAAGRASRELDDLRAKGQENTAAFRLQSATFQGANGNLLAATKRYNLLGREISETLNPALREQRLAQEAANKAARDSARAQADSATGISEAIDSIEKLNEALGRSGVKTQVELEKAADSARELFEASKATGAATNDQRRAFEDYVKKLRAANEFATDSEQRSLELRLKLAEATIRLGITTENAGKKKLVSEQDIVELERLRQAGIITQATFEKLTQKTNTSKLKGELDKAGDSADELQKKAEIEFTAKAEKAKAEINTIQRGLDKLGKGVTINVRLNATGNTSLLGALERANLGLSQ